MSEKKLISSVSNLASRALLARGPPEHKADFPVVGIGASAGGLKALTGLITALPDDAGMAYILVQHLDPTHESLMGELLAEHTEMPVLQADEGMIVERDHIYVIPSGVYLSVAAGTLHLSKPTAPHGARLPVDFLFESMANDLGAFAIGIILSGTGSDGTKGIKAVHDKGGFILVQDPAEASHDGMPQSAVASGFADAVLSVAMMPAALQIHAKGSQSAPKRFAAPTQGDALSRIIDYLRTNTAHNFALYKMGTLQRRIERRMALASIPATEMERYLNVIQHDAVELNLLATDLLINVTSFFRDPGVFEYLTKTIVPDMVRSHSVDAPLRVWVAGCSTGEEAYSLAMIFSEAIAAAKRAIKLSIFASDVDPDAVATAREGAYPDTISADVSPERLERFFVKTDHGFAVGPDLRANIVFTIQNFLADPPFSKLDFVSCRNVLIYLGPEAQAKVIALFHLALQKDGVLLLGTSETVGHVEGQFKPLAKSERIYRRVDRNRSGALLFSDSSGDGVRVPQRRSQGQTIEPQPALADLCRRLVLENLVPAAVVINRNHDCLYSMGPTERYLRVAPGYATHDLLAMAKSGLRNKLRAAIGQVTRKMTHLVTAGGHTRHDGRAVSFDLDIRLVIHQGEELLLISFVDRLGPAKGSSIHATSEDEQLVAGLQHELDTTRTDLSAAMHDLELSDEEHRAVNEEALSVNEEYQSANEELLTSKEELQSLNEELTALNSQLQETLERQRTTSNDLQNVLYSTKVATLFLDTSLKIRFYTPATKKLFNLIPGDIGRPLADLRALSVDPTLAQDAQAVLVDGMAHDCEVEVPGDSWFMRHILPYRTDADGVEGVVITFTDITEKKHSRAALEVAKREAEQANLAKSRFLAAASHDLRQPLQSLALLQGLLAAKIEDPAAKGLLGRLEQTLTTMSGMLNTMLDINQIEAGVVTAVPVNFVIGDLIDRVQGEFVEQAHAQKLELRFVRSNRVIHSDPVMIEQMLRNLVSNALKYTKRGKILLGCRQFGEILRIEVWDTGVGIAASQLDAIFDEYHQIDNAARERSLGLGLGLSIVQRLGALLGHKVGVRSLPSRGSVFSIDVTLEEATVKIQAPRVVTEIEDLQAPAPLDGTRTILIVDDDPELRDLLDQLLKDAGYRTAAAGDSNGALAMLAAKTVQPELLLADYNLPGALNGLQLAERIRETMGKRFPVVILTGDISTTTLRAVADGHCVQLNKPVKREALLKAINQLLEPEPALDKPRSAGESTIYIVDDDSEVRRSLRELLEADGRTVEDFGDCEAFLAAYRPGSEACLLIDAYLPGIDGVELLRQLKSAGYHLPAIMITGSSAVPMAVEAMKVGAIDFIEKPVAWNDLLSSINRALELSRDEAKLLDWQADAKLHLKGLTKRQHQVMEMVLAGHPSKNIAADLGISQRTVENHRASIMKKTGTKSLPALARLALAATGPVESRAA
jgi:two-component system, chemotaxis family, CheB/CheR fusion protein